MTTPAPCTSYCFEMCSGACLRTTEAVYRIWDYTPPADAPPVRVWTEPA